MVLRANPFGFVFVFSGGWSTVDGTNPAWVSAHSRFTPPPPNFNIDMYLPITPGRSMAGNPASQVFTTYFSNIKVWGQAEADQNHQMKNRKKTMQDYFHQPTRT